MNKTTCKILSNIYDLIEIQKQKSEKIEKDLLASLDFFKNVVELRKEINEHMQLIHDISGINLTQQNQIDNTQKQLDYIVNIIADHVFWEKGEDNRGLNFKARIEEIKNEKID